MTDIQKIIIVLNQLESAYPNKDGYNVKTILQGLNLDTTNKMQKKYRAKLRSMIDKKLFPEFATAGNKDIVYCPKGKNSGMYRLSKYR